MNLKFQVRVQVFKFSGPLLETLSAELTIVSSLKHKNTQPLYILNRARVLHLDRLKEGTWLHSFGFVCLVVSRQTTNLGTKSSACPASWQLAKNIHITIGENKNWNTFSEILWTHFVWVLFDPCDWQDKTIFCAWSRLS